MPRNSKPKIKPENVQAFGRRLRRLNSKYDKMERSVRMIKKSLERLIKHVSNNDDAFADCITLHDSCIRELNLGKKRKNNDYTSEYDNYKTSWSADQAYREMCAK